MATALERWRNAGLKEVVLPSGHKVRGVLPTVEALAVHGGLPAELSAIALQFASPAGVQLTDVASDEFTRFMKFAREMAALFVRDLWDGENNKWEPVTLTAADFANGYFDPGDIDVLETIALRQGTPKEPSPVTAWAEFPQIPAGADDRPGGGEVRDAAIGDVKDQRPGSSGSPRRSHRAKTDARREAAAGANVPPG